jgi:hypothetical protein
VNVRGRRSIEIFSLSFLDVISCGFGAVILLLVLTLVLEPATVTQLTETLAGQAVDEDRQRQTLIEDGTALHSVIKARESELRAARDEIASLQGQIAGSEHAGSAARALASSRDQAAEALESVRQKLSKETKRLLRQSRQTLAPKDAIIGGIPVDSEYIIFIIDTSGSMLHFAWPLVVRKVEEILRVYPRVKGIQVMNDMGKYMFSAHAGRWIPDTPARRKEVLRRLRSWQSFSNSSPVEGILAAVRRFHSSKHRISLYVFGDDFSGDSIDKILAEVHTINRRNNSGKPRVRIHAFGYPVLFLKPAGKRNRTRFAHLMRRLSEQNAGSFVGLPALNTDTRAR